MLLGSLLIGMATLLWAQVVQQPCTLEVLIGLALSLLGAGFLVKRHQPQSSRLVFNTTDRILAMIGALAFALYL